MYFFAGQFVFQLQAVSVPVEEPAAEKKTAKEVGVVP